MLFATMLLACTLGVSALTYDSIIAESYVTYRDPVGPTSSYQSGVYYDQLISVPLTGDGARDSLAVALSQVGYLEGDSGDQSGTVGGDGNYTEFGRYMSTNGAAWCASFVSFAYYNARVTDLYDRTDSCDNNMYEYGYWWSDVYANTWSVQLDYFDMYRYGHYYGGTYIPEPGDTVFFTYYETPLDEDHIGMVVYCDGETVYTIEGNTSSQEGLVSEGGGVFFKSYDINSSLIAGYGVMPFETVEGLPEIDYSGANPTTGIYVAAENEKSFYSDTSYTSSGMVVPFGKMFEVLDVVTASDGDTLLYSKVNIGGYYYYGYILHGTASNGYARTVQIYANEDEEPALSMSTDVYEINEEGKIDTLGLKSMAASVKANFTLSDPSRSVVEIWHNGVRLADDDYVGTGAKICLVDSIKWIILEEIPVIVKDDVDGDGEATASDYTMVRRHVIGTYTIAGDAFAAAALVDGKEIVAFDYLLIKRAVLGTYQIK